MTAIGMIGAGNWGSNWIRTLATMPDVELRWCCDLNEASLDQVRRQFPHVQTTTRADDVLADKAVEGVVIATIAPTHFDVARRAIEAGKHVMVEKPMTLTTADAAALTALARLRGRVLMVGHLLEYHPAVLYIKDMIDSGELGEVYYLYSQRLNLGTVRTDENSWWSLAPHDISVACRLLTGCPLSVQCRGQDVVQPGIADVVFATLEFPAGRIAHVHVSWLDPHKTRKLTVVGSRKMVVFDDTLPAYKVTVYDKGFQLNQNIN
ncbi:MAG TPA: Gfo/Idh/MocA family oxidoreductase, partial [Gemmataceae bacterium]|nr:Gfo/Idh/MocA family oxidoreductase [Gemmataceae bacterium]